MTPERLEEIREWIERKARVCQDWQVPYGTTIRIVGELLAEVDRLRAENYLLKQGRGGTPETHVADDRTPLHLTHPIENSRETT